MMSRAGVSFKKGTKGQAVRKGYGCKSWLEPQPHLILQPSIVLPSRCTG